MSTITADQTDVAFNADTTSLPPIRIPADAAFPDHGFILDHALGEHAAHMIETFPELADCDLARIKTYWKKKGGSAGGHNTLGKCSKASGVTALESNADYIIWLAADHLRISDEKTIIATLYHELRHIEIDIDDDTDEPTFKVRGHDAELFASEIERFGLYKLNLRTVAPAFEQQPLVLS